MSNDVLYYPYINYYNYLTDPKIFNLLKEPIENNVDLTS